MRSAVLRPVIYDWAAAPPSMQTAAEAYRDRFRARFDVIGYFPDELLHELQDDSPELPDNVDLLVADDPSVPTLLETITRIANVEPKPVADRRTYFDSMLAIYERLPGRLATVVGDPATLCVAPEREGRMFAEALDCLPQARSITPHAKRVPFDGGLLVAIERLAPIPESVRVAIVDGVIASGATLITTMEMLRPSVPSFHVFTAHATAAGIRALASYARAADVALTMSVGIVSGRLNEKFYAVAESDPQVLVVGDVGDTIVLP